MSSVLIENLMYEMVSQMTVANGFNYDWIIHGDGDTRRGNRTGGAITIDFESETNTNDNGGIGSARYIDDARVYITGKVNLVGSDVRGGDVNRLAKQSFTKALDDIKTRYDSPKYLNTNGGDCRGLIYQGAEFIKEEKEGKFRSMRVRCEFLVKYVTQRKFIDNV